MENNSKIFNGNIENTDKKNSGNSEKENKTEKQNNLYIKEFSDYLSFEKGSSKNTVAGYERDLKMFFHYIEKLATDVTEEDIYEYIRVIGEDLKRNSVLRKIASIRTFYKFCYLNKMIKEDPTGMIKSLKREKRLPEVLNLNEVKAIIDNFNHTPEGMRDRLIIKFLIATGARVSEILNLDIKDVENQGYEFIKVLGKGSKYRVVPIYDGLEKEIREYIMNFRPKLKGAENSFRLFPDTRRENFWKRLWSWSTMKRRSMNWRLSYMSKRSTKKLICTSSSWIRFRQILKAMSMPMRSLSMRSIRPRKLWQ